VGPGASGPKTLVTGSQVSPTSAQGFQLNFHPAGAASDPGNRLPTPTAPNVFQQLWFRSSSAYWYDPSQAYDTNIYGEPGMWFQGKSIRIDEYGRSGESVESNQPPSIVPQIGFAQPGGPASTGVTKRIDRDHLYRADTTDQIGLNTPSPADDSAPIPNSRIVYGDPADNTILRRFGVATTTPDVRVGTELTRLQFGGRAQADVAGWKEIGIPGGAAIQQWKERGRTHPQLACRDSDPGSDPEAPCVQAITTRRSAWTPIQPGGGDDQLAATSAPHGSALDPAMDPKAATPAEGFFQVRLRTRNPAIGTAGIRSLMVRDLSSPTRHTVRALYVDALKGNSSSASTLRAMRRAPSTRCGGLRPRRHARRCRCGG